MNCKSSKVQNGVCRLGSLCSDYHVQICNKLDVGASISGPYSFQFDCDGHSLSIFVLASEEFVFFTTSQRVVRFYHSCSSPPSPLPPPPRQSSSPTSSPILIAKLLANPLRQLLIAVGTAGPQLPASDRSGHPWTSTASVSSQWASLDLNRQRRIPVGTPGPQPPASDLSGHPSTSTTRFYHQTLSQSIITKHHHKASSQYIITKHHRRPSSQIMFAKHHRNTS